MGCGCDDCEKMMQPYMDRVLSEQEITEAQEHLERCPHCDRRYKFEEDLRHYVRVATDEPMTAELRAKLVGMRSGPTPQA
jgi:anti-sigma factor (TIGR02949 family)